MTIFTHPTRPTQFLLCVSTSPALELWVLHNLNRSLTEFPVPREKAVEIATKAGFTELDIDLGADYEGQFEGVRERLTRLITVIPKSATVRAKLTAMLDNMIYLPPTHLDAFVDEINLTVEAECHKDDHPLDWEKEMHTIWYSL